MTIQEAHEFCNSNKNTISKSEFCGCFYCEKTFKPSEIKEWVGSEDRALCPHCGIDSVLPDFISKEFLEKKFLHEMYEFWFGN